MGIKQSINKKLDTYIEKRAQYYVNKYGKDDAGNADRELGQKLYNEVMRRGEITKELYIHETLQWAGVSFILGAGAGLLLALLTGGLSTPLAISFPFITGAVSTVISFVRLKPRFDASLRGGVFAALKLNDIEKERKVRASQIEEKTLEVKQLDKNNTADAEQKLFTALLQKRGTAPVGLAV